MHKYRICILTFALLEVILSGSILPFCVPLARHFKTTTGTVTQLFPEAHGTVAYTYVVSGRQFNRSGSPKHFRDLSVGSRITVYYNPYQPDSASLLDPHIELLHIAGTIAGFSAFISFSLLQTLKQASWPSGSKPNHELQPTAEMLGRKL